MNELNFVTTSAEKRYLVIGDIHGYWNDFCQLIQRLSDNQNDEILIFGELLALSYPPEDRTGYEPMKVPTERVYVASHKNRPVFQMVSLAA